MDLEQSNWENIQEIYEDWSLKEISTLQFLGLSLLLLIFITIEILAGFIIIGLFIMVAVLCVGAGMLLIGI